MHGLRPKRRMRAMKNKNNSKSLERAFAHLLVVAQDARKKKLASKEYKQKITDLLTRRSQDRIEK